MHERRGVRRLSLSRLSLSRLDSASPEQHPLTNSPMAVANQPPAHPASSRAEPLRLHIGGEEVRAGWKIVNIQAKPGVDHVGSATDLSAFAAASVTEIYASHIYEHLDYKDELPNALHEAFRVLRPGGIIRIGVPDLDALCRLMLTPGLDVHQRYHVQRMIYGGHVDDFDYHYVGLTFDILSVFLTDVGFTAIRRLPSFDLFKDATTTEYLGVPVSLNVMAMKPQAKSE